MSKHEKQQSVFNEPHLREERFVVDPSENRASHNLRLEPFSEQERIEQGVLEEIALGRPVDRDRRADYFLCRRARVGTVKALLFLLGICLLTSCFTFAAGILFSVTMANVTGVGFLAAVTVAPPVEEFSKILLPLWIIEVRPWLFRWRWEVPLVCLLGGLSFAVLENLTYLHVYIDDPRPGIVMWRWTVCTTMHMTGAMISSFGVLRYWDSRFTRSDSGYLSTPMRTIGPFLAGAIAVHATYNLFAILFQPLLDSYDGTSAQVVGIF